MAFDAFLKLDGIAGESTDKSHPGEIEIESFSWGASNTAPGGSASGGGAGKVSFQDIHFTMSQTKASPALLSACVSGKHISTGQLTLRKAGGSNQVEFLKIKLQDVLVSSYQTGGHLLDGGYSLLGGNEDVPTDQVSLNFAKIEFLYTTPRTGEVADTAFDSGGNVIGAAG